MGVFDSVWLKCPECGRDVEFQSKQGRCTLAFYQQDHVPVAIAADLNGRTRECVCGYVLTARFDTPPPEMVTVEVE